MGAMIQEEINVSLFNELKKLRAELAECKTARVGEYERGFAEGLEAAIKEAGCGHNDCMDESARRIRALKPGSPTPATPQADCAAWIARATANLACVRHQLSRCGCRDATEAMLAAATPD